MPAHKRSSASSDSQTPSAAGRQRATLRAKSRPHAGDDCARAPRPPQGDAAAPDIARDCPDAAFAAQQARSENACRRACNLFGIPRHCPRTRCRRAQTCTGNARDCLQFLFSVMPAPLRTWFQVGLRARAQRKTSEEAARIADETVQRHYGAEATTP